MRGGGHSNERRSRLFALRQLAVVALYLSDCRQKRRFVVAWALAAAKFRKEEALASAPRVCAGCTGARGRRNGVGVRSGSAVGVVREGRADEVADRFGLSRRQVERILNGSRNPDDTRAAVVFGRRLREQPPGVQVFVNTCLFHRSTQPSPSAGGVRSSSSAFRYIADGCKSRITAGSTRTIWADWRRFSSVFLASPGQLRRRGRRRASRSWFLPDSTGVLPPGLWAVVNHELA